MPIVPADLAELALLNEKIARILPEVYHGCFESVSPTSMGSAGIRYGPDGRVAWDEIWTSFCNLALAGGPPHRGALLAPAPADEVAANPEKSREVGEEIVRGIALTTSLPAEQASGWVTVRCPDEQAAAWLAGAVMAENVYVRREGVALSVPAGPGFRVEKEVKNVIVSLAKTWHYWRYHMPPSRRVNAVPGGQGFPWPATAEEASGSEEYQAAMMATAGDSALPALQQSTPGWVGLRCSEERMASWLLRALAAEGVLVRREAELLFLPVGTSPGAIEAARKVSEALSHAERLWVVAETCQEPGRGHAASPVAGSPPDVPRPETEKLLQG